MNPNFKASTAITPVTWNVTVRQAHAARAAFVATILIGFGKKIKDLVAGPARGATSPRRLQGSAA